MAISRGVRLADPAQAVGKVGHGFAVFAVHHPEFAGEVEEQVQLGVREAGADTGSGMHLEPEGTSHLLHAEPEQRGGNGQFQPVAFVLLAIASAGDCEPALDLFGCQRGELFPKISIPHGPSG